MKIWVLTLSFIFSSVFAFADTPTIWVSTRTDGLPGTGTQSDPINLSTPALFDAYFQARFAAHYSNYSSTDPVIFRFLPGTYTSNSTGIWAISGWQLLGSGQGSTILHFPAVVYSSAAAKDTARLFCIQCNWGSIGITVQDMTIDAGVRDTGTALSASFVMPPPQESVTITIPDASKLIVGKWYYVQDTAMTNDKQQWFGVVTCTAINGNSVTLKNAEVATSGTVTGNVTAGSKVVTNVSSMEHLDQCQPVTSSIFTGGKTNIVSLDSPTQMTMYLPSNVTGKQVPLICGPCFTDNVSGPVLVSAYLFPYSGRTGVQLQSSNMVVQRVTVQDISIPFYEGAGGIEFDHQPVVQKIATGNLIDHCTIRDMFGRYACYILANSANIYFDASVSEQVTITNNTVLGNGYYQGIGVWGISNSLISGNNVRNVGIGYFCDTGYCTGITVTNNTFTGADGIRVGIGPPCYYNNSTFTNNIIVLTTPATAVVLDGNSSNNTIANNTISTFPMVANNSVGLIIGAFSPGAGGNMIYNNQVLSTLYNRGIDTNENQILTPDEMAVSLAASGYVDDATFMASLNQTASPAPASTASSTPTSSPAPATTTSSTQASSTPTTSTTSQASSTATTAAQTAAKTSSTVASAAGSSASHAASLVDRINHAVVTMQAISTAKRGAGQAVVAGSPPSNKKRPRNADEADEQRLVMQLNALVHQMND